MKSYFYSLSEPKLGDDEKTKESRVKRDVEKISFEERPENFEVDSISVREKRKMLKCEPVPTLHLDKISAQQVV